MEIFLVQITTGEYEDKHTSILNVCLSLQKAESLKQQYEEELTAQSLNSRAAMEAADILYDGPEFHGVIVSYTGAWISIRGPYTVTE